MNKTILFLLGLIFLMSSVSSTIYCYQETTNQSSTSDSTYSQCGLNYTNGRYDFGSNLVGFVNQTSAYDGDYNNYSVVEGLTHPFSDNGAFYAYYPRPKSNSVTNYSNIWYIRMGPSAYKSLTIPTDCVGEYLNLSIVGTTDEGNIIYYRCMNKTDSSIIYILEDINNYGTGDDIRVYEEGIYWATNLSYIESNITYNNISYETSTESFTLNFVLNTGISAFANLYYNRTSYPSNISCVETYCTATNSISVPPIVSGTQQNNSFYWEITVYNGTSFFVVNSSVKNQTVNQIGLSKCDVGTIAINFTSYDEQNRTRVNPFSFDADFTYSTSPTGSTKSLSITNVTTSNIYLCPSANTTFYLSGIIAYSAPALGSYYQLRNYFFQNFPISNNITNIPLYLLTSSASTQFILQVQDASLQPLPQVLIKAQRCYSGLASNETVFIHRTDSSGLTTGNLEAYNALYQFFITNNSNTLLSVIPCAKVVPQTTPYTLIFTLGDSGVIPFINIANTSEITSTISFNKQTNILTWTYVDSSSSFVSSQMIVRSMNYTGNTQPIACTTNSTLSTAVLSCNMSTAGTYTVDVYVTRENEQLIDHTIITVNTVASTMGYYGVFLGFLMILISAFLFKWNEIAGIWMVNVAVIICNFIGFIDFGYVFITAMLCVSALITAVLER